MPRTSGPFRLDGRDLVGARSIATLHDWDPIGAGPAADARRAELRAEADANAALLLEAVTVASETGLTPRHLLAHLQDLHRACATILPYLPTTAEILDAASLQEGRAAAYHVACQTIRYALTAIPLQAPVPPPAPAPDLLPVRRHLPSD